MEIIFIQLYLLPYSKDNFFNQISCVNPFRNPGTDYKFLKDFMRLSNTN